jgi:hypothetical protein
MADLNGDGLPDVAAVAGPLDPINDCADAGTGNVWVFLNNGNGGFAPGTAIETPGAFVVRGVTTWLPAGARLPSLVIGDLCDGNIEIFPNTTLLDAG